MIVAPTSSSPGAGLAPAVRGELERRRAELAAGGPALELVGPPASPLPAGPPGSEPRIVSIGWMAAQDDVDGAARALAERLAPDGWLHLVEPTVGAGRRGRIRHLAGARAVGRLGWHVDADVPDALRRAGFLIVDLERFSMPRRYLLLDGFVAARARLRSPR